MKKMADRLVYYNGCIMDFIHYGIIIHIMFIVLCTGMQVQTC